MEKKFKPYDRVIYRGKPDSRWYCDLYSFYDEDTGYHITMNHTFKDKDILPYEGNEHLVGTTDEPEEEVRLEEGEWGFACNLISDNATDWEYTSFLCTKGICNIMCNNYDCYLYFIRFKNFDPSNMEKTRKHILCVKNGKIIRYKD